MKVWVIDSDDYPEVIGVHRSRETAQEAAEIWLDEQNATYANGPGYGGYKGWEPCGMNMDNRQMFFTSAHGKGRKVYVYATELED